MTKLNRAKAYKEFYNSIESERKFFMENGMSTEDTEIIVNYTTQQFKSDCVYNQHNISLYTYTSGMEEEGKSPFIVMAWNAGLKKTRRNHENEYIPLSWIDTVKNTKLRTYLEAMKIEEKIILTELTLNKRTQIDVASHLGLSRQTVSKIYNRILGEIKALLLE